MSPKTARYYLKKNWPLCCTAALTRYIPDFTQHLWMKTADGGLAAVMYAPNVVETELAATKVKITTVTDYPFGENLKLTIVPAKPSAFPLRLRMPEWCTATSVAVNGEKMSAAVMDGFMTVNREWTAGDVVALTFPMKPFVTTGRDRNKGDPGTPWCAVSAGPLLFACNLEGVDENTLKPGVKTDMRLDPVEVAKTAKLERHPMPARWRWEPDQMPVTVSVPSDSGGLRLVPYGSTCLRISMFECDGER